MLGHAAGHVRMMMLHGDQPQPALTRPLLGPPSRKVARMQVVDHGLRLDFEGPHQVLQRLLEELQARQVFEVAQMLALVDKPSPRQRKDVFHVPADGQQGRRVKGQRDPQRHKSPRPPEQLRRSIHHRRHRIVAALQDFAVVHQEGVGNPAQARQSLAVVDGDGLFAQVGRGHHQRPQACPGQRRRGKEQVLQWRIRQKNAQPGNSRRHSSRNSVSSSRPGQHNRPRRGGQQRFFLGRQIADCPRRLQVAHHHRQRLSVAPLALAQAHHRRLAGGVHAQVKAANPFDGHDLARSQKVDASSHSVI